MTICKNCGAEVHEIYCGQCGQDSRIGRVSIKELLNKTLSLFVRIDKGVLKIIPALLIDPGQTVRNYLNGQRQKYINPLQFLVIMTGISTLLTFQYHILDSMVVGGSYSDEEKLYILQMDAFVYRYMNIILFIGVPVFALITYLFFKRSGYNYAENLAMQSYYAAERSAIFSITIIPLVLIFSSNVRVIMNIYALISIIYFYYAFAKFFEFKGIWMFIKGFLSVFCYLIFLMILILIIFFIFIYKS